MCQGHSFAAFARVFGLLAQIASAGDIPWTDFTDAAAWRATAYSANEYHERYKNLHPLNRFPGSTVATNFLDVMHILDYQGITSRAAGGSDFAHGV